MARSHSNLVAIAAGVAVVVVGSIFGVQGRLARRGQPVVTAGAVIRPAGGLAGASDGDASSAFVLHVPHAPGSILLDGDTDDRGWVLAPGPARTHEFLAPNGTPARPFSEIRFVWGDGFLYMSLYASDEDIESRTTTPDGPLWLDDAFRLVFTQGDTDYAIEVSPRAIFTDAIRHGGGKWDYSWSCGAHASPEMDGTLNDSKNMDEEWVIEMALPFESVGLQGKPGESIGFAASRCDTPKGVARVCAAWGDDPPGRLVLQ